MVNQFTFSGSCEIVEVEEQVSVFAIINSAAINAFLEVGCFTREKEREEKGNRWMPNVC